MTTSFYADLQENVEVFLRLTGLDKAADKPAPTSPAGFTDEFPEVKGVSDEYSPSPFTAPGDRQAPVQSFSLSYGARPASPRPVDFELPGDLAYPQPQGEREVSSPEPIEAFYRSLELDARMVSQLLSEGDSY